jgi:dolichyl-phosphate-mannose-protein mannosyltransferase
MKTKILFSILLASSIATHIAFLGQPAAVVFDEVHYGKFINGYLEQRYFFDIHPPLGKEILWAGAWLAGYQHASYSFENIGDMVNATPLRAFPLMAGIILPLILYAFARSLKYSHEAAFTVGMLVVLENALLAHSRLALPDMFLLVFGFAAATLALKNHPIPAGLFAGMAAAVKWTGFAFIGFIALAKPKQLVIILPLAAAVYIAAFVPHFTILSQPGPGDAFMSKEFQTKQQNLFEKTIELNKLYYTTNRDLTFDHPYSSKWYSWPVMQRPIFYWVADDARVYLLGNPVIWWASSAAVLMLLFFTRDRTALLLIAGYLGSFLPFILIGRVLFLYHYFTALCFAMLILVYLISKSKHATKIYAALLFASFLAFLYFAPLTYGLPLTPDQYEPRVWFSTWR